MTRLQERLIEVLAYNLYRTTLVGNPAPWVKALHDRMNAPQVGDLVLETSTIYSPNLVGIRLGRLQRVVVEPMYTPEQWREAGGSEDDPIPTEPAWYLTLADGSERRWANASFIAVPTEISSAAEFTSDPRRFSFAMVQP